MMNSQISKFFELLELNGLDDIRTAREFVEGAGFSLATDLSDIESWLIYKSEAGDYKAQHALAQFYLRGAFGYMDKEAAYKWCEKSAQQDYGPAVFLLASMKEDGREGTVPDRAEAICLLHKAITLSHGPAARLMGLQYLTGTIVPKNVDIARNYLAKGAELGDSESMFHLALMLRENGESADQAQAVQLLERAASANNASALRILASMYGCGLYGCKIDEEKAKKYTAKAEIVERPYTYDIDTTSFLRPKPY